MKKKLLALGIASVMLVGTLFAVSGCNNNEKEPPEPEPTEEITFSTDTNPYADTTWEEYGDLFDWDTKWDSDAIYYIFEGSYSEAYQGNYSRTYLYMNCYEDGSLHAQYGNENYYGYWTNVDRYGRPQIVLHIVRYNNGEYNNGSYESVVSDYESSYYEYQSSIIWNQWGTRTVLIFGYRYSPVTKVELDTSSVKKEYLLGEQLNTANLGVTLTRESGATGLVEEVSGRYTHVKYSGYDPNTPGTQTISVSYDRETVSATYQVTVADVESVSIDVSGAKKEYSVGDSFDVTGITVTEVYENDATKEIPSRQWTIDGFDSSAVVESQTITISYGGQTATFDITVKAPVYTGSGVSITINTPTTATIVFDGKTVEVAYTTRVIANSTVYTFEAPEGGITGATEEEWNALHKTYILNNADKTAAAVDVYVAPNDDGVGPEASREEYEFMPGIGGGTTNRFIIIDKATGTATITYKYYYDGNTDVWVYKYTLDGNKLTLTERVSAPGWTAGSEENLVKNYILNDDGTVFTDTAEEA